VGVYVVEREMDGSLFLSCVLIFALFISPCQKQCELLPSLGVRRPSSVVRRPSSRPSSVNFSHFNLLL
jgi:hypothetical protein